MKTDTSDRRFQKQLNSGATALALLGLLSRAKRPTYGYEIAKHLEKLCGGELPMNQGALYPVLRALEQQGFLSSYVEPSVAGPARKYYSITSAGRGAVKRWTATWQNTIQFVNSVLEGSDERRKQQRSAQIPARARD
jgi:PadR family transcriptional regulator PadR